MIGCGIKCDVTSPEKKNRNAPSITPLILTFYFHKWVNRFEREKVLYLAFPSRPSFRSFFPAEQGSWARVWGPGGAGAAAEGGGGPFDGRVPGAAGQGSSTAPGGDRQRVGEQTEGAHQTVWFWRHQEEGQGGQGEERRGKESVLGVRMFGKINSAANF